MPSSVALISQILTSLDELFAMCTFFFFCRVPKENLAEGNDGSKDDHDDGDDELKKMKK